MKRNFWYGLVALAALASDLRAEPLKQFNSREEVRTDPEVAYIFYRTRMDGAQILFVRDIDQTRESPCNPSRSQDCRDPQAVADVVADPRRWVQVTGQPRFTAERAGNSYLIAVEPGPYTLYGNMIVMPNGMGIGICHCMGSLRFEARAGQVVDLGEIVYPRFQSENRPWGITVVPFNANMPMPARLAGMPVFPAEFRASGKLPNYFGVEIDRHDALPDVLAYDRDRVIDVRTGAEVPPGY